ATARALPRVLAEARAPVHGFESRADGGLKLGGERLHLPAERDLLVRHALEATTASRRCATRSTQSRSSSMAAARRPRPSGAAGMDPDPAKGSSTRSPGLLQARKSGSSTENGLWLGWLPKRAASPSSSYPAMTDQGGAGSARLGTGRGSGRSTSATS